MDDDDEIMDTADWKTQLQPNARAARQRIINKMVKNSIKFFPVSGPEGLAEVQMIASRFEDKIYTAATSQSDYIWKISMKMLTMEKNYQTTGMANTIPSTSASSAQNPPNPVDYVHEYEQFMDCNNWRRPIQAEPDMDTTDWRTQLQPDSRQRVVNKIMETMKRHLPMSGPEGLVEINRMAARFENKIFDVATSQSDYIRKISMKMLTMETNYHTTGMANTIPSTSAGSAQNPPNPVDYVHECEQFMDCNNWRRPIQAEPDMDTTDWRTQLQPDSRQRVVNKIMETMKRHLPMSGPEGLVAINRIAARFENKIFYYATSQSDYLRKISLKMLAMETKVQTTTMVNTLPSNFAVIAQNPLQPAYYVREDEEFMDCNNCRPTQAEPNMDTTDWRTQLQPDSRQRIVNKMCRMEFLKRHKHLQNCGLEGLTKLKKIAVRFENRIYTGATSQSDYLRKISLKLLAFENSHATAQNPPNSGLMHTEQLPEVNSVGVKIEAEEKKELEDEEEEEEEIG